MGSVQQITLGIVVLGAAFILGHYANQQAAVQDDGRNAEVAELDSERVWQKRPAAIKTFSEETPSHGSFVDLQKQSESDPPEPSSRLKLNPKSIAKKIQDFPNIIQPVTQEVEPDFSALKSSIPPTTNKPLESAQQTPEASSDSKFIAPSETNFSVNNALADNEPSLKSFSESDFAPQLKKQFKRRLSDLRTQNKTPQPDNSVSKSVLTLNNDQPYVEPALKLQAPVEAGLLDDSITPLRPKRDNSTKPQRHASQEKSRRLVPFQLTAEAQSRLVGVSRRPEAQLRVNTSSHQQHVVTPGDTLQKISQKYYGKPDFYLDIYVANQRLIRDPTVLRNGITLKIPVFE